MSEETLQRRAIASDDILMGASTSELVGGGAAPADGTYVGPRAGEER